MIFFFLVNARASLMAFIVASAPVFTILVISANGSMSENNSASSTSFSVGTQNKLPLSI
jgi:hypothetical protein